MSEIDEKWYALFVLTGEEIKVKRRLERKFKDSSGLTFVVPRRRLIERKAGKWEEKIRTVFPGYILANGTIREKEYYSFEGIPGLLRVLKDSGGPHEIPGEEIEVIKKLIRGGEIIDPSSAFEQADKVIITDGPLLGLEGLIHSVDKRKGRAKVRLNFAGEPRLVDLSVNIIQTV
ncbi:MAG: hypothetical protein BWY11_02365 [Firmicutes bacterium ADurb.Bin182]|nr:MAG: hypothetical protein BWY11_02365 [Firmicutes bacterium ADurb.Bin182]